MSPNLSSKQLASLTQDQLAQLSRENPQLVSQMLLARQGLQTNPKAAPGAPPVYGGAPVLSMGPQDVTTATGHPLTPVDRADNDYLRFAQNPPKGTVLGEMGNAAGDKLAQQQDDNRSKAALAMFYKRRNEK